MTLTEHERPSQTGSVEGASTLGNEGIKVASSCERGDVYRHRAREALSGFPDIHADYKDARGRTSFRRSAMIPPSLDHDGRFARFA